MNTYTLAVPATSAADPLRLALTIMESHTKTDRINLRFGTCELMCRNEEERDQHGSNVRAEEAIEVLLQTAFDVFVGD